MPRFEKRLHGPPCTRCQKYPRSEAAATIPEQREWCSRCRRNVARPSRATKVPCTSPGALCTRCQRRPQAAAQRAKAAVLPPEQLAWCHPCRSNVRSAALRAVRLGSYERVDDARRERVCRACKMTIHRSPRGGSYLYCAGCRAAGITAEEAR